VADTPTPPADDAPKTLRTPTSVRIAVLAMWIMAGLLLADVALNVGSMGAAVDQAATVNHVPQAQAQTGILLGVLPVAVLGLMLGVSAWGLARRHAWARWTGLGATLMIFALLALTLLAAGRLGLVSLLMLLLAITASITLLSRSTAEWIPRLRGGN
jgi:hypothetical protein